MDRLTALEAFVRVVELGSFSAVASELRVKQSTVSKWIAALEQELDCQLVARTTRSLRVTDAGASLLGRAKDILAAYEDATAELQSSQPEPRGRIRVSAPVVFGRLFVLPHLSKFMRRYRDIEIDLVFNDRYVNLVEEGFDVGVRVGLPRDTSFVARTLGRTRRFLVASPGYLQRRGSPAAPADLREHDCLVHTGLTTGDTWIFERKGQSLRAPVRGRFAANNSEALLAMARGGLGIALLASWLVQPDLRAGRLVDVLSDYQLPDASIQALTPPGRRTHPRVRAFIDFLAAALGDIE